MIAIGSGKQLYIGGMVLAALFILGYNGVVLMSLFQPKILGRSIETKLASQKWLQLENSASSEPEKTLADIDLETVPLNFTQSYYKQIKKMMVSVLKNEPEAGKIREENQKQEREATIEIQLPGLAGIAQVSDVRGNIHFIAVIEGKRFRETESVQGFTVQKITDKGVFLTKAGKRWFIPIPEVHYSVDQGG